MLTQLEELWNYAQSIDNDDEPNPEPNQFKEISKEVIQKTVAQIDAKLSGNDKASSKAKKSLYICKVCLSLRTSKSMTASRTL